MHKNQLDKLEFEIVIKFVIKKKEEIKGYILIGNK